MNPNHPEAKYDAFSLFAGIQFHSWFIVQQTIVSPVIQKAGLIMSPLFGVNLLETVTTQYC